MRFSVKINFGRFTVMIEQICVVFLRPDFCILFVFIYLVKIRFYAIKVHFCLKTFQNTKTNIYSFHEILTEWKLILLYIFGLPGTAMFCILKFSSRFLCIKPNPHMRRCLFVSWSKCPKPLSLYVYRMVAIHVTVCRVFY